MTIAWMAASPSSASRSAQAARKRSCHRQSTASIISTETSLSKRPRRSRQSSPSTVMRSESPASATRFSTYSRWASEMVVVVTRAP